MNQSKDVYHFYVYNPYEVDFILDNTNIDIDTRDKIEDLAKFKSQLENQGLMTNQLEEFINNYLRFDNN